MSKGVWVCSFSVALGEIGNNMLLDMNCDSLLLFLIELANRDTLLA